MGEKVENINEVFGEDTLEKLRKLKTLEWIESNKR